MAKDSETHSDETQKDSNMAASVSHELHEGPTCPKCGATMARNLDLTHWKCLSCSCEMGIDLAQTEREAMGKLWLEKARKFCDEQGMASIQKAVIPYELVELLRSEVLLALRECAKLVCDGCADEAPRLDQSRKCSCRDIWRVPSVADSRQNL